MWMVKHCVCNDRARRYRPNAAGSGSGYGDGSGNWYVSGAGCWSGDGVGYVGGSGNG
jgi:hypothetical protein